MGYLFLTVFLFVFVKDVRAYIDPGTGSYIFQLLIGVFVGLLFTLKLYWKKVKNLFSRKSSNDSDE